MAYWLILLLALAVISVTVGQPWLRRRRRLRLAATPLPYRWRFLLENRVPLYRRLPGELQRQVDAGLQIFLAEKRFYGCNGLVVTDEIRLTVAAQACLLLLNRSSQYYPALRSVLVYPDAFVVRREYYDEAGVYSHDHEVLAGESWEEGKVIVSWGDVLAGAQYPQDGVNVILHEFAHQLDHQTGFSDGMPVRVGDGRARWSDVFAAEYESLKRQADDDRQGVLDHYGATDAGEFFAVATEAFFELSQALRDEHAALYRELARIYYVDPASW